MILNDMLSIYNENRNNQRLKMSCLRVVYELEVQKIVLLSMERHWLRIWSLYQAVMAYCSDHSIRGWRKKKGLFDFDSISTHGSGFLILGDFGKGLLHKNCVRGQLGVSQTIPITPGGGSPGGLIGAVSVRPRSGSGCGGADNGSEMIKDFEMMSK